MVIEFAKGNMRTYLILKEKVKQFNEDKEIQALLQEINGRVLDLPNFDFTYSDASIKALKGMSIDRHSIAAEGLNYEKLDQLTMEILLGVK